MNNIESRFAVIFPGNLSSYFICLDNYKILCESKNIDIYILYSNEINYIHTLFPEINIDIKIDDKDIILIDKVLGKNIKYISTIEDEFEYKNYLQTYINIFRENSKWIDNLDEYQLINPNKNPHSIVMSMHRYIDQFVRIKFLYDKICKTNIHYDYIVRLRIDQLIDKEFLHSLFINLDRKEYPIVWNTMDNIYVIHHNYFNFFDYLINNLGSHQQIDEFKGKNYQLGSEIQFGRSVLKYFKTNNIYHFNSLIKKSVQTTMGLCFEPPLLYLYDSLKSNPIGIPFVSYLTINNVSKDNYKIKLENLKTLSKIEGYLEKYKSYFILFYHIRIT